MRAEQFSYRFMFSLLSALLTFSRSLFVSKERKGSLSEVVLAEVLGYCKRTKDHGYLCGPCFPGVMAAK